MTVCIAVTVPCKALNPLRRPLEFSEPGIVLAADTRFSWVDDSRVVKVVDDGIKIWPLSDWAIAGFSGDVELGEVALFSMRLSLRRLGFRNHNKIAQGTQTWFLYYERNLGRDPKPTEVVLCTYDAAIDGFFLYVLSSQDSFRPKRREGVWPIGSGTKRFIQAFRGEVDHYTSRWEASAQAGRLVQIGENVAFEAWKPGDCYSVKLIEVASLVLATLDSVLRKADLATVGGLVQAFMLLNTGWVILGSRRRSDEGTWEDVTARDLRSYSEVDHRRYEIPRMREDCSIEE